MRAAAAIIFSACILLCCKKSTEKADLEVPFHAALYFHNGDSLIIKEGDMGENSYGKLPVTSGVGLGYFERQFTSFNSSSDSLRIIFMKLFPATPDSAGIESMFHTGAYSFASASNDSSETRVEIILKYLNTEWRSAIQSPDTFVVTTHKLNDFDDLSKWLTAGFFRAHLKDGSGNILKIDSANFSGRTVVYP